MMARWMKTGAAVSVLLTVLFALLKLTPLTITAATFAYHLLMRLAVGLIFDKTMRNRANPDGWWFRQRAWEPRLYEALRVSQWKTNMPSYQPDLFDRHKHTWDEIAQAMCQAELVHETIIPLSFLPVAAVPWLGALPVFLITSTLAACFDLLFVLMQRYNRPRVLQIAERVKKKAP